MRYVFHEGRRVGHTRKFVGETARTMGCEPAWVGYPTGGADAAVFDTYKEARRWVLHNRP